jgi:preprotein translocase subunit SecG
MDRENIMSQFWAILFLVLFIIICFLLVVVVLLQKGRGGGLGAAFGGAGSSAFGTGDVFTWITIVLTALFLLLAVSATVLVRPPMRNASDPVFTPTAEPIEEATAVQIRCYTPRVKIYYTLDGSTPSKASKASKEYVKAVMVQPGVTVKAIAVSDETNPSNVVEAKYPLRTAETEPESRPATPSSKPASYPASGAGTPEMPAKTPATTGAAK